VQTIIRHISSRTLRITAAVLFLIGGVAAPAFHRVEHARAEIHHHVGVPSEDGAFSEFLVTETAAFGGAPCILCAKLVSSEGPSPNKATALSPRETPYAFHTSDVVWRTLDVLSIRGPPLS
jgi:hypothetical protein